MIPIVEIHVLNPRQRDQKKFEAIINRETLNVKETMVFDAVLR
jgi:hypothetical protein